jgi:molybdopterin-guanine dinucleotide biosynthesis protein A
VLTGGTSRRMGRDKATLLIDGLPMARRVADALLGAGCVEVVTIGSPVEGIGGLADDDPGAGPLGAVVTALRWAGERAVIVAACDLVAPDPAVFADLAAHLAVGVDAVVPVSGERLQPLAAVYAPSALAPLAAAFDHGERSITAAMTALAVRYVEGLSPSGFVDADTPGDLPDTAL